MNSFSKTTAQIMTFESDTKKQSITKSFTSSKWMIYKWLIKMEFGISKWKVLYINKGQWKKQPESQTLNNDRLDNMNMKLMAFIKTPKSITQKLKLN